MIHMFTFFVACFVVGYIFAKQETHSRVKSLEEIGSNEVEVGHKVELIVDVFTGTETLRKGLVVTVVEVLGPVFLVEAAIEDTTLVGDKRFVTSVVTVKEIRKLTNGART